MRVTKHAEKRIKERINIPKASIDRIAGKAISDGLKHGDVSGRLKKYVDSLYFTNKAANNIRIYNQKVFLFTKDMTLITVLPLPNNLKKCVEKDKKKLA